MTRASPIDTRQALMDRSACDVYITQKLCEVHVFPQADILTALPSEK